jgi:pimeloyl-[acyl-carrier protein] synthase
MVVKLWNPSKNEGAWMTADIDFSDRRQVGEQLFSIVRDLRNVDPILWSEKSQAWIVTGHEEVVEGFSGRLPLSSVRLHFLYAHIDQNVRDARIPYLEHTLKSWIINTDGANHIRMRQLMRKAFAVKSVETTRPFVRQVVKETLACLDLSGEVEFIAEVATKIPPRVLMRFIGLPDEFIDKARNWAVELDEATQMPGQSIEVLERAQAALVDMREHVLREVAKRRKFPTDDFLSLLLVANDDGDRLSDDELMGICHLVLLAGHSTTANTLGLATAALAENPAAVVYMRAHPDRMLDCVMELMRFAAMSANQPRVVAEDFEWRGHHLKQGQFVHLNIAGANRDPKVFQNPDAIDFLHPQENNMTFAQGAHFCIGHYLAKIQLTEFYTHLLQHYEFDKLRSRSEYLPMPHFRALRTLPLRLRLVK